MRKLHESMADSLAKARSSQTKPKQVKPNVKIKGNQWEDNETDPDEVIGDLQLITGTITFTSNSFIVDGETINGDTIHISQKGEFNMSGGSYSPKMGKIKATLNNQDVFKLVKGEFDDYGWDGDFDASRTDIYGHIF